MDPVNVNIHPNVNANNINNHDNQPPLTARVVNFVRWAVTPNSLICAAAAGMAAKNINYIVNYKDLPTDTEIIQISKDMQDSTFLISTAAVTALLIGRFIEHILR